MRKMSEKEAEGRYGKEMKDGDETYFSLVNSEFLFCWDHKSLSRADSDSNGSFLKKLDDMLKPHGLEVIVVNFDGDMAPWFIDKIPEKV